MNKFDNKDMPEGMTVGEFYVKNTSFRNWALIIGSVFFVCGVITPDSVLRVFFFFIGTSKLCFGFYLAGVNCGIKILTTILVQMGIDPKKIMQHQHEKEYKP